ncbi:annexin A7-like [Dysidea avara]|uniref:annexin A7-like n=1 Tax=Dysidea avara TaxID=196820 RepID=UPI00332CC447
MASGGSGTVKAAGNFNAEKDAEVLRKAMKGLGTDEKAIINVLAFRSCAQRQEIKLKFKSMYGRDLVKDLKSELGGNLEEVTLAMMEPCELFDAKSLRKAMKGAGTDEAVLIEVLCTRTNTEIHELRKAYKEEFSRDLEKDIESETSGHFKKLLVSLLQGQREESGVDEGLAAKEAQELYDAGEKRWGTDESMFNKILVTRSYAQLQRTFDIYTKIAKRDVYSAIQKEMSGNLRDGMQAVVRCVHSRPMYFAEKLYKSMKGLGTDDNTLIRVVVSRSEKDLEEVKAKFLEMYHKTLGKMIEGDCSGDYKRMLLAIVGQ